MVQVCKCVRTPEIPLLGFVNHDVFKLYFSDVGIFNRLVNNDIYLFGGDSYPTKVQVLAFPSSEFDDKSIVLLNGSTYKTQLLSNDLFDNSVKYSFSDVWLYEDENGLILDIPTYYGDGTNWNKIKN